MCTGTHNAPAVWAMKRGLSRAIKRSTVWAIGGALTFEARRWRNPRDSTRVLSAVIATARRGQHGAGAVQRGVALRVRRGSNVTTCIEFPIRSPAGPRQECPVLFEVGRRRRAPAACILYSAGCRAPRQPRLQRVYRRSTRVCEYPVYRAPKHQTSAIYIGSRTRGWDGDRVRPVLVKRAACARY